MWKSTWNDRSIHDFSHMRYLLLVKLRRTPTITTFSNSELDWELLSCLGNIYHGFQVVASQWLCVMKSEGKSLGSGVTPMQCINQHVLYWLLRIDLIQSSDLDWTKVLTLGFQWMLSQSWKPDAPLVKWIKIRWWHWFSRWPSSASGGLAFDDTQVCCDISLNERGGWEPAQC